MSNSTTPQANRVEGIGRLGTMAAKKRQQLERFDAERKRMQEKQRREREELAREVAEVEARDRRRMRNEQQNDQKRIKFVLGGLVLTALIKDGRAKLSIASGDLDRLSDKDKALLAQVLAAALANSADAADAANDLRVPQHAEVDLPV
jgi:hypothetical protein